MAAAKGKKFRGVLRLRGGQVDLAIGILAAALLEVRSASAEDIKFDGLSRLGDPKLADQVNGVLREAVATNDIKTMSLEELKTLLSPEHLADLGIDAKEFAELLQHDPKAAIAKLEAAFAHKLHLASFDAAHKAVATFAADDAGGGSAAAASGGESMLTPALIIGGVIAGGVGVGFLVGSGGNSSSSGSQGGQSVNSPPLAITETITTSEDKAVTFDPRTNDTDANSDALTITAINGTVINANKSVTVDGVGTFALNADGTLTFTPVANFNGTPTFTYTISDGRGGTATVTDTLTITAVDDAPVNTVPASLSGAEGASILLTGISIADIDSTSLTTKVHVGAGLLSYATVTGGATVTGSGTDTLTLVGTVAQINASLAAISFNGGPTLFGTQAITVTTSDGTLADTDTFNLNIAQVTTGAVSDGYISGATVFVDLNGNGVFDPGEPTGTTDATGHFAVIGNGTGTIIAFGGTNIDTGLANTITFRAPAGSISINPLTTVLQGLIDSGMSLAAANSALLAALGLPAGTDLTHLDPLAPGTSLAFQKAAAEIAITINAAIAHGGSADDLFAHLADLVAGGGSVDLTDSATLADLLSSAGVPAGQIALLASQVAAANDAVDSATSLGDISSAQKDADTETGNGNGNGNGGGNSDTLTVTQGSIDSVVANASTFAAAGKLHLDVLGANHPGEPLTITDAQANTLADAGLDFVENDVITVEEDSEEASTTLKELEGLDVDGVKAKAVGGLSIDAGAGGLGGLDAGSLPTFTGATGGAVDVTLNIDSGSLDPALDLGTLVPALGAAGIDHVNVTGDGHLSVSLDQAESFVGSGVDFVAGNDITLNVASAQIGVVTGSASGLGAAHIDHIDVTDNSVTIDDGQATSLINAGLDFVTSDNVTVEVAGTHTSTTLKGLQDLHVDSVKAKAVGGLSIDAGSGGLGGLSAGGLPHFITDGGATAHVTLDIASGTLGSDVNLGDLAPALHTAGIDHIDVTGSGDFTLSAGQALDIANAGVDFVASDNITITTGADQIAAVVGGASALGAAHIDHIDVTGDQITIDDSQASSLVSAGLDFVTGDDVTVSVDGTHLSTSLKGLQDLHVDSVAAKNVGFVSIDAGSGPLSADNLPSFTIAQSDAALDVTLNVNDGVLPGTTDIFHLAPALGAAGIDHIGVSGDGHLTLSAEQALDFVHSGVDFASAADITVSLTAANLPAAIGHAGELSALNVDHLDVSGHVVLDDTQAATLIGDGLDFATADDITVQAHGTHLSTSLGGLQALHVDTVVGDGIHNVIKLDAGDISFDSALPQFASGLDVTLDTHSTDFLNGDIVSLTDSANKLLAAGIDHIGIEQPLETLTADQLATIAQIEHDTGLNFVYDPTPAASAPDFGSLVSLLEGVQPIEPTVAGVVAVSDAATASLIQSGALQSFLGETLVVDATDSGDKMLTSLKSLGDLGVDSVLLPHGDAPVYVDLGFGTATPTTAELTQLLNTVDPAGAHEPLFSGATHVGLVVDQASLDALAGVSGSLTHLADLGFTEIDVLDGTKVPDALANDPHVEIKIIGPDGDTAELYDHLHHQ
jgi:hypothetical protein